MFEFDHESRYIRELEIALPQWPVEMIKDPLLEIEDILAVQSLTMGYLRTRARTKKHDLAAKNYGFAMIDRGNSDNDAEGVYDGTSDTYMSCLVRKIQHDQWRMSVSMLDVVNTEMTKKTNIRRMHRFDWLKNGNCQAWYTETLKTQLGKSAGVSVQILKNHPISSKDCINLQNEMLAVSERANPISSESIYVPEV